MQASALQKPAQPEVLVRLPKLLFAKQLVACHTMHVTPTCVVAMTLKLLDL